MSDAGGRGRTTWVVVAPNGVYWVGLCDGEDAAWEIALGWPDEAEIADHKARGWYAAEGTLTWRKPDE